VRQPVADALLPLHQPQLAQFLLRCPHPPPPPWGLPTRPAASQPHLKLFLPPPPRPLLRPQQPPAPPHPQPSSIQAPHQALLPFSPQAVSSQSLLVCQPSHLRPLHPQSHCFTQGSSQVQHPQLQLPLSQLRPQLQPHQPVHCKLACSMLELVDHILPHHHQQQLSPPAQSPPPLPPPGLQIKPVMFPFHLKLFLLPLLRPLPRPHQPPQQPLTPLRPRCCSTQGCHLGLPQFSLQAVLSQSPLARQPSRHRPLHPQSPCFTLGSCLVPHPQLQLLQPPLLQLHLPLLLLRHLPLQLPQSQLRQQQLYPQVC